MKKQNSQRLQTVLLATISTIIILGTTVLTFAQSKTNNFLTFDHSASNASQNLQFKSASEKFDVTGIQANDLFTVNNSLLVDDYPAPDFSEMEKWYEIVKYEYGDIAANDTSLYYWVKPKTATLPTSFHVDYFDKDGVASTPWSAGCAFYAGSNVGQVVKCQASTPVEKDMEKMVRAKFVRNKQ